MDKRLLKFSFILLILLLSLSIHSCNSQNINTLIIPDNYEDVIKALECGEKLEIISSRYKINEIGYKAKKEGV